MPRKSVVVMWNGLGWRWLGYGVNVIIHVPHTLLLPNSILHPKALWIPPQTQPLLTHVITPYYRTPVPASYHQLKRLYHEHSRVEWTNGKVSLRNVRANNKWTVDFKTLSCLLQAQTVFKARHSVHSALGMYDFDQ